MKYTIKQVKTWKAICPFCEWNWSDATKELAQEEMDRHIKLCLTNPIYRGCRSCCKSNCPSVDLTHEYAGDCPDWECRPSLKKYLEET
jgi:hypothetical protein